MYKPNAALRTSKPIPIKFSLPAKQQAMAISVCIGEYRFLLMRLRSDLIEENVTSDHYFF